MEETYYYVIMVLIFFGLIVLPVLFLRFTKGDNNKAAEPAPRLVNKSLPKSSVPVSPAVSEKTTPSKETAVVKTIYKFIPEVYMTGDIKWTCTCCETENSRKEKYCKLCGTSIRNG